MKLFTIGFTQTTAEAFFERLQSAGARCMVDIRLNRTSQLAGFAKFPDLAYFLDAVAGIGYRHEPLLAPTPDLFNAYKKKGGPWDVFVGGYKDLLDARDAAVHLAADDFKDACLLCSEATADHCHRSLAADYLTQKWGRAVDIVHL